MLVRTHRGILSESMATVREIENTTEALIYWVKDSFKSFIPESEITADTVSTKYCGYDQRIKWDTHYIILDGLGVVGMSNQAIMKDKEEE